MNEELFNSELLTHGIKDPELLIRTSGEKRISNFLLWQLAYSEIYITDVLWPCLLYTSPSPRDGLLSRMPSSA